MQILMLTQAYPRFEGDLAGQFIQAIAQSIAACGHTVHVLAPEHPLLQRPSVERGVHLHTFRYAPRPSWATWGYAQSLWGDVKIKGRLYALAPVVFASAWLQLDHLAARYHPDIIHAHWVLPNGPIAWPVAARRKRPLVVSLHGSDVFLAERNRAMGWMARQCLRAARAVTAPSEDLLQRAGRFGAAKLHLIPYGADPQAFSPSAQDGQAVRNRLGLAPENLMVLAVGRLVYKKGFSYLIDALPQGPPQTHLVLVGEGDQRAELQARVQDLGLENRVHFTGRVPHTEIPAYLAACDVFTVPSVHDDSGNVDGLPNTALEAMAAGKPVIASRLAGLPQIIQEEVNGFLVDEKDSRGLGKALTTLAADRELRRRMGEAGRARVLDELNWSRVAEKFIAIYEQVTRERGE